MVYRLEWLINRIYVALLIVKSHVLPTILIKARRNQITIYTYEYL